MEIINIQHKAASTHEHFHEEKKRIKTLAKTRHEKVQALDSRNRYQGKKKSKRSFYAIAESVIQGVYKFSKKENFDLDEHLPAQWDEVILDRKKLPAGVHLFLSSLASEDKVDIILSGLQARHDNGAWNDAQNYALRKHKMAFAPFELQPVGILWQAYEATEKIFEQFGLTVDYAVLEREYIARKKAYVSRHGIKDIMSLTKFLGELEKHYGPSKAYAYILKNKANAIALASEISNRGGYCC